MDANCRGPVPGPQRAAVCRRYRTPTASLRSLMGSMRRCCGVRSLSRSPGREIEPNCTEGITEGRAPVGSGGGGGRKAGRHPIGSSLCAGHSTLKRPACHRDVQLQPFAQYKLA